MNKNKAEDRMDAPIGQVYRVVIRGNLTTRIGACESQNGETVFKSKLETGTQLARNHHDNGCIDGDYLFASIHVAKDFAVLSLDFIQKLAETAMGRIDAHNFYAEPNWSNTLVSPGQDETD